MDNPLYIVIFIQAVVIVALMFGLWRSVPVDVARAILKGAEESASKTPTATDDTAVAIGKAVIDALEKLRPTTPPVAGTDKSYLN